jgi:putative membrane protein
MAQPEVKPVIDDPRIYFAEERTFLAWVRTGLGLMGVGFAVSRFGLFLREMRASETHTAVHGTGLSSAAGVTLVFLGVAVHLAAVTHHVRNVGRLKSGTWVPGVSRNAIILAVVLALMGIAMAVYLLYLR